MNQDEQQLQKILQSGVTIQEPPVIPKRKLLWVTFAFLRSKKVLARISQVVLETRCWQLVSSGIQGLHFCKQFTRPHKALAFYRPCAHKLMFSSSSFISQLQKCQLFPLTQMFNHITCGGPSEHSAEAAEALMVKRFQGPVMTSLLAEADSHKKIDSVSTHLGLLEEQRVGDQMGVSKH